MWATAKFYENGLPDNYYVYMTTRRTGLNTWRCRTLGPNRDALCLGPFQLTSKTHPYPTLRQQPCARLLSDVAGNLIAAVECLQNRNPSGCLGDLFPWVEVTVAPAPTASPSPPATNDTPKKARPRWLLQRAAGRRTLLEVSRMTTMR